MTDFALKAKDLVKILKVSKGYVSDIWYYKKRLSKDVIRKLSLHFKVSQEFFNRLYALKPAEKTNRSNTRMMHNRKKLASA